MIASGISTIMRLLRLSLFVIAFLSSRFEARAAAPILKVITPEKTLTFTASEFAALPRAEVKMTDPHDQRELAKP